MPILRLLATLFIAQLPALWALNPAIRTTSGPAHELEVEAVNRESSQVGELPELTSPHPMLIDNGRLIVLDDYQVHVYTLDPLALKHRFGGQGTGVGQFQYPGRVYAVPGGLLGTDFLKSIWFTEDGSVRREVDYTLFPDFDPNQEMVLLPASSNFVRITSDHDLMTRSATLVDGGYQPVKTLDTGPYLWNKPGTRAPAVAPRLEVHCEAEEIYVADGGRGFVITVYDTSGTQRRTIDLNQELEPVPFTADDWEVFSAGFQAQFPDLPAAQIETMFTAPEYFPAFHQVTLSDGRIYVTTYRERDGLHEMLVLDTEGNLLDRMYLDLPSFSIARRILRFDLFDIDRNQLFELVKNAETGIWELYVTDLN